LLGPDDPDYDPRDPYGEDPEFDSYYDAINSSEWL
jgi:hypothetical protein